MWACASLLHCERETLGGVIEKIRDALVPGGIVYMSFKYGDFEGERDGRFFVDMTSERFHSAFDQLKGWLQIEEWESEDVRRDKNVQWYNAIIRKV